MAPLPPPRAARRGFAPTGAFFRVGEKNDFLERGGGNDLKSEYIPLI